MNDALLVNVTKSQSEFSNPKSNGLFCERLPANMETCDTGSVSPLSNIESRRDVRRSPPLIKSITMYMYSMSWKLYRKLQMNW